jgi:hypothetical protein
MVCAYFDQVGLRRAGDTAAPPPPRRETGAVALIRPRRRSTCARCAGASRTAAGSWPRRGIPTRPPSCGSSGSARSTAVLVAGAPGALAAGLRAALPWARGARRGGGGCAVAAQPTVDDGSLRGFLRAELTRFPAPPARRARRSRPVSAGGWASTSLLSAVDLVGRLERRLGCRRSTPTLLFEHRTIDEVAACPRDQGCMMWDQLTDTSALEGPLSRVRRRRHRAAGGGARPAATRSRLTCTTRRTPPA